MATKSTTIAGGKHIPIHINWSSNSKTGHIPVSTTGSATCPDTCKHKQLGTCYANFSFVNIHWKKVDSGERDMGWKDFIRFVSDLPEGQLWRHNQAGDIIGLNKTIDSRKLLQLIDANRGKRGFTYTHKPLTHKNLDLINYANSSGFAINVSCDSVGDALKLTENLQTLGYTVPVTVTVPEDYVADNPQIKVCPAQIRDDIDCVKCQWCAKIDRSWIVAFKMHGSRRKQWKETSPVTEWQVYRASRGGTF